MSRGTRVVVVAATRRGAAIAARLGAALAGAEVHVTTRWLAHVSDTETPAPAVTTAAAAVTGTAPGTGTGTRGFDAPLGVALPGFFREPGMGGLVVVLAVGATVRILAPWLRGKDVDPAVVCVDDGGRFAVAVLGGHRGGANALAARVADVLGACAVITTASDADDVFAVDLLGADAGWRIEATPAALRYAAAAVVNGDRVAVYQDAGDTTWQTATNVPANVRVRDDMRHAEPAAARLIITDRALDALGLPALPARTVVYRPPTLVAGLGCSTGATTADLATAVDLALAQGKLARASLAQLATLDRRLDEPGVVDYARHLGLHVRGFTADALADVPDIPNPSTVVEAAVGTHGVCEPAALLASGATTLLVPKVKTARATAAIARIPTAGPTP